MLNLHAPRSITNKESNMAATQSVPVEDMLHLLITTIAGADQQQVQITIPAEWGPLLRKAMRPWVATSQVAFDPEHYRLTFPNGYSLTFEPFFSQPTTSPEPWL
jgi:hypothetical protein